MLEHVGISEYIGYVGRDDLNNNGLLETKFIFIISFLRPNEWVY
jgi:hypothetical protein